MKDKSIDSLLDRTQKRNYRCFDFVREAWLFLTGEDIAEKLQGAFQDRRLFTSEMRSFKRLEKPSSLCVAVFQRRFATPHVGIYMNGSILHLTESGVSLQPLSVAMRHFKTIRFYQ